MVVLLINKMVSKGEHLKPHLTVMSILNQNFDRNAEF